MNILSQLLYLDSLTEFNVAFHPSPAEKKERSGERSRERGVSRGREREEQ